MDLPDLGEDWPTVEGYRYRKTLANRIGWSKIFMNPGYSDIVSEIGSDTDPIYVMIEKRYNEKITEVQQQISAVIRSPEIAKHVKAKPGTTVCKRFAVTSAAMAASRSDNQYSSVRPIPLRPEDPAGICPRSVVGVI